MDSSDARLAGWARLFLLVALVTGPVWAQDGGVVDDSTSCTQGCHEDLTTEYPKHLKVTCLECHPNIPDGKADHVGALDDTPTEKMCATAGCHPNEAKHTVEGKHKDAACETCHGDVHGTFKLNDEASCRQCHKEAVLAHVASPHAKAEQPVTCAACHGDMHDIRLWKDPASPMSKLNQLRTCVECHEQMDGGASVKAFVHSVHGEGLTKSGLVVAPTCSDCHGSHAMTKAADPASKVSRRNIPQTCGTCHTFITDKWLASRHGAVWQEEFDGGVADGGLVLDGGVKAPVCNDCHGGHEVVDPGLNLKHLAMVSTCEKCHPTQSSSYRHSFHGKAANLGFGLAATCADCHTPHEMLSKSDPKSSVHADNLQKTCGECHKDANANFVMFLAHDDPSSPDGNKVVHTIWYFMTALLIAVLGFFTVHTVLWFQRSLVGFFRKEFDHGHEGTVWIRRFKPVHIWIHLMIIVTFLALAATGLPLKFSAEGWARAMATVLGGVDGSRLIHRVAGVLTFGYGVWFVGYLMREIVLRKRRSLLWGWQSMVPNLKDLKDLVGNLKWFLYLGERPRLDRWAYWEKFDFFAVFWGVPVIGFSGLFLWNSQWVSQYFPGWVLNIAYLVHSDEALLATGFIFFFHFFHTHLRPEAFPLDPVIFTGSMSLERFKAERPAEFERLEASGELEQYKVPAPGERQMQRIYAFGFTALALGVVMGALLLTAFFRSLAH